MNLYNFLCGWLSGFGCGMALASGLIFRRLRKGRDDG